MSTPKPALNTLAREIYLQNKCKGFHHKKHSIRHHLCLVATELMEAIEADRKGLYAQVANFKKCLAGLTVEEYDLIYEKLYTAFIKNTVEDELADTVIRLLDMAGAKKYKIKEYAFEPHVNPKNTLTENLWAVIKEMVYLQSEERIYCTISEIEELCRFMNIDLWYHVNIKLKYNTMRPYRHDKKY